MASRDTDQLSLGTSWWIVAAIAGAFALLLGGLALLDRAHARQDLTAPRR